ncbi:MAG: MerR family transcriptional regulator [Chloroflexi bacterium]|nr:MerR family transcriptional regulator [Chloroflexota bacterium]
MRISELSVVSGVPVPTVKFYLREGLLAAGDARAVNQAEYGDEHLRRLRLIRALTDVGGLRLREVRAVLAAIDDELMPLHDLLGVAQYALVRGGPNESHPPADDSGGATSDVDRLLAEMGWHVNAAAPSRRSLAQAIFTLRELRWDVSIDDLVRYARAVDDLAAEEVATVPDHGSRSQIVEHMVVGTVIFEAVLTALRRLAQEHHSARRFAKRPRLANDARR